MSFYPLSDQHLPPRKLRIDLCLVRKIDRIARALVFDDVLDTERPAPHAVGVDPGDPVVHPPVGEDRRVIRRKDVQVSAVREVVCKDGRVALLTDRADDAHVGRLHAPKRVDRLRQSLWRLVILCQLKACRLAEEEQAGREGAHFHSCNTLGAALAQCPQNKDSSARKADRPVGSALPRSN
eukprot:5029345-Pleurochrysis_carterae.AAC.1